MAISFGFYDSVNQDRMYNAQHFSSIFNGIINDGVFMSIGDHFNVIPNVALGGMNIVVGTGRAWFNGTWTDSDSDIGFTLDPSHVSLNRIDSIILEVNKTSSIRANSIKLLKGYNAVSPLEPTLINTTEIKQYLIARISIPANLAMITATHISNRVGGTACPYVTGILDTIDTSSLVAQWNSAMCDWLDAEEVTYDAWFTNLQNQLDTNQASNLQNQIDQLEAYVGDINPGLICGRLTTHTTKALPEIGETGWDDSDIIHFVPYRGDRLGLWDVITQTYLFPVIPADLKFYLNKEFIVMSANITIGSPIITDCPNITYNSIAVGFNVGGVEGSVPFPSDTKVISYDLVAKTITVDKNALKTATSEQLWVSALTGFGVYAYLYQGSIRLSLKPLIPNSGIPGNSSAQMIPNNEIIDGVAFYSGDHTLRYLGCFYKGPSVYVYKGAINQENKVPGGIWRLNDIEDKPDISPNIWIFTGVPIGSYLKLYGMYMDYISTYRLLPNASTNVIKCTGPNDRNARFCTISKPFSNDPWLTFVMSGTSTGPELYPQSYVLWLDG